MIADYLLAPEPRYGEFIDRATVARLVAGHADGTDRSHGRLLLSLLMLEVWLAEYLPRAKRAAAEPALV